MRQKDVRAHGLHWGSLQVSHICLTLDIKNKVDCSDPFFLWRGRRLSWKEITNRSVNTLHFSCSFFLLFSVWRALKWWGAFIIIWHWKPPTVGEHMKMRKDLCKHYWYTVTCSSAHCLHLQICTALDQLWGKREGHRSAVPGSHVMKASLHHNVVIRPQWASTGSRYALPEKKKLDLRLYSARSCSNLCYY